MIEHTVGEKVIVKRSDLAEYEVWDCTLLERIGLTHFLVEFTDGETTFTRTVHVKDIVTIHCDVHEHPLHMWYTTQFLSSFTWQEIRTGKWYTCEIYCGKDVPGVHTFVVPIET